MKSAAVLISTLISAALALTMSVTSASAHHAAGAYDKDHIMSAKVVLDKFVWENPHLQFYFDEKKPDGTTTRWLLEAGPPISFLRNGFKASDFNKGIGTTVTMSWCGTKSGMKQDGMMMGFWQAIAFADGTSITHYGVQKTPPPEAGHCN